MEEKCLIILACLKMNRKKLSIKVSFLRTCNSIRTPSLRNAETYSYLSRYKTKNASEYFIVFKSTKMNHEVNFLVSRNENLYYIPNSIPTKSKLTPLKWLEDKLICGEGCRPEWTWIYYRGSKIGQTLFISGSFGSSAAKVGRWRVMFKARGESATSSTSHSCWSTA